MTIDCLLFIEEESPLTFAFEMLLGSKSGIKAVKSNAGNLVDLVGEVCDLKSQVIILEDLMIHPEEDTVAELLASSPDLKIIIVLQDSNFIYVFRKEEIMIQSSSDFINAIRSTRQNPDEQELE